MSSDVSDIPLIPSDPSAMALEAKSSQEKTMSKDYTRMTRAELARATHGFDAGNEPRFLKPPLEEKRRHDALLRKIKRRRGRPPVGAGGQRVQITVEGALLQQANRFARENGISRSQLIAQGLLLAMKGK